MLKRKQLSVIIIGKSELSALLPVFWAHFNGGYMKAFLNNYSYSAIKMFVNQFAISIFGAMLSMATTAVDNNTISVVASVAAILFYLFLIYTMTWDIGAKDRISVDIGKKKKNIHTGVLVALIANIPNMLIAIVYSIGYPFMGVHMWAGNMCTVVRVLSILLQGMYFGVTTSINVGGQTLNFYPITYVIIMIPSLLTCWAAYSLGFKNKKLTTLFNYEETENNKRK